MRREAPAFTRRECHLHPRPRVAVREAPAFTRRECHLHPRPRVAARREAPAFTRRECHLHPRPRVAARREAPAFTRGLPLPGARFASLLLSCLPDGQYNDAQPCDSSFHLARERYPDNHPPAGPHTKSYAKHGAPTFVVTILCPMVDSALVVQLRHWRSGMVNLDMARREPATADAGQTGRNRVECWEPKPSDALRDE